MSGDGGHRSPCLTHAKRALYHLSYIPILEAQYFPIYFHSHGTGAEFPQYI